ncbi:MAG: hypothetical protein ATN35_02195 [Epulopiscium sp. Nele67-Bin004]|nr:MAG: hypothetical protein ATN35_02195 [Epulopiscium sp. Nele67-Bin004]
MQGATIELLQYLSDNLNVGDRAPAYRIKIYRKDGDKGFEVAGFEIRDVTSITLDRRYNMSTDDLTFEVSNINGQYSPDYGHTKKYRGVTNLPLSGYRNVMLPYNKVTVELGYGTELVRVFTGLISKVEIVEETSTLIVNCNNMFSLLLNCIDPIDTRSLVYENQDAFVILKDLLERAGITEYFFEMDEVKPAEQLINSTEDVASPDEVLPNAFIISRAEYPLGTFYADAVEELLNMMNHRIFADRYGLVCIRTQHYYSQNDFHVYEVDDYINITEGEYKIDPTVLRNRVIVQANDGWQAFEDKFLLEYCNQQKISCGIEAVWADTEEKRWAVADAYFLDMRRKLRTIRIATKGNPTIDIEDLIKVTALISTATAKYRVVGCQTLFNEQGGYIDILDLEFTAIGNGHLCEPAPGDYINNTSSSETELDDTSTTYVTSSLREQIINYARSWLGTPYQWGGDYINRPTQYFGVDCSWFTWGVLGKFGLMTSYTTSKYQYKLFPPISRDQLQVGDLVFYGTTSSSESIHHVGMYLGNDRVISASGGGPSTTTLAAATKANAKVKEHSLTYMQRYYYYASIGV